MFLKKNTASQTVGFCLVNASSGAALTGATVSVRRCIDGTFAATTGTVTEDSGGLYKFAPSQADTNGDQVTYYFTATSAIPVCLNVRTTAADMSDTVRFGLTALPNTAVTTNASLLTSGTGTDQISVSSGKVLLQATQTGVTIPTVTTVTGAVGSVTGNVGGNVTGSVGSVTAAVTLSAADGQAWATGTATAGGATSITLQTALGADSLAVGSLIKITSGTGAGQTRVITAYVNSTKVVTVGRAWVTNPDNTSVYAVLYSDVPKIDSSLKISGVVLADTITTYTGNTPQTGDSFARIGSTGSGLTSLAPSATALSTAQWSNTLATNLTTLASHDPGTTIGTSTLTAANVWDLATSGHTTSGTFGAAAVAAGGAGDPWSTSLPGSYGAGTAGYIIGNRIDAAVTSRLAPTTAGRTLDVSATGEAGLDFDNVKDATGAHTLTNITIPTVTTAVNLTNNNDKSGYSINGTTTTLDALQTALNSDHGSGFWTTATGFSTHSAADVWAVATRVLTAGTNIVLAKGTGITGFNDIAATAIVSGGAITTSGGAVSTVTTLTNLPAVTTDWLTAAGVSAAGAAKIADVTLRRTMAHVFASSDGDAVTKNSLYGSVQQMQKSSVSSTTMTILNTDGSTLGTLTVTASAGADPITGVS